MIKKTLEKPRKQKIPLPLKIFVLMLFLGFLSVAGEKILPNSGFLVNLLPTAPQVAHTDHGWNGIRVNRHYGIPGNYNVKLMELSNGQGVDARMYPYLQRMFDDARAQGVYPEVVSGYRTSKEQRKLLGEKILELRSEGYSKKAAKEEARKWVGAPGTSEHEIGLAVDINGEKGRSTNTQVYQWLAGNAWRYGFILRYPADKVEITGIYYEPWHYRYVGEKIAAEIFTQNLSLEEYVNVPS